MVLVLLYLDGDGQLADTACWRRCHASIKSRQTSPIGDERQNKRKSGPDPADSLKVSQLAAGRDLLHGVGRHRRATSKQQASKRHSRLDRCGDYRRRACGSSAGLCQELSSGLMVMPGATMASMRSSSASSSSTSTAASWPSSCSIVRGPISAAVIAGWRRTKAIASWISVIPASSASRANSSTASSLRWLAGCERSKRSGSRPARDEDCCPVSLRHRPDSHPPVSGLYDITPMPWREHAGRTSASIARTSIEYGGCSGT